MTLMYSDTDDNKTWKMVRKTVVGLPSLRCSGSYFLDDKVYTYLKLKWPVFSYVNHLIQRTYHWTHGRLPILDSIQRPLLLNQLLRHTCGKPGHFTFNGFTCRYTKLEKDRFNKQANTVSVRCWAPTGFCHRWPMQWSIKPESFVYLRRCYR